MTTQSVLSERVLSEFSFPNAPAVSESVNTTVAGGGTVNRFSGRMSVFVDQNSPAVIRLTHSTVNKPTFLLPENEVTFPVGNPTESGNSQKVSGTTAMKITSNNAESVANDTYIKFTNHVESSAPPITPVNVTSNLNAESHNSLLNSESNIRPASRQSTKHVYSAPTNENCQVGKNLSDEEDGIEHENGRCNSGITTRSTATLGARKSSSKKGKRKKRAKSSHGSKSRNGQSYKAKSTNIAKTKLHGGITDSKIDNSSKTIDIGIAGLGTLESSFCKPVVLHKHPPQEKKNGAMLENSAEHYHNSSQSHRPFAVFTSKVGTSKSTPKSFSLPQMNNNFMVKTEQIMRTSDNISTSRSYGFPYGKFSNNHHEEISRVTKIYLSDKHSGSIKDCGMEIPCAPPVTPTPEQLKNVEYVPSMNDIRSQRAVKVKLQVLEREAQKKSAKKREEMAKMEKQNLKEREKDLKVRQRMQIYALNKVMTELENSRFVEFCQRKGISIS